MIDRACISLNDICNLNCKYCHFNDKSKTNDIFSNESLLKIIDEISGYCISNNIEVFKLGIVGNGEPMINKKQIFLILNHIKNLNYKMFRVYTISNGTLINSDDINFFYDHKEYFTLCFSLDGHEEIHNAGREKFDKVFNAINEYKKIFKESPKLNATVNNLSYLNKEKLIQFLKDNDFKYVNFSKLVGYSDSDLYISSDNYKEFMLYAEEEGLISRQFNSEKIDCTMYGNKCGVGLTNIYYTTKGVYPCGRFHGNDKYLLGKPTDSLFDLETNNKKITHCNRSACYYNLMNGGIK